MLNKIAELFWRIAGFKTFAAALLIYSVFGAYIMPKGIQHFEEIAGHKVEMLDLQFSYTPDKAKAIIAGYGDECRSYVAQFELIGDGLYPISYTFLFLMIMSWLFKSLSGYGIRIRYIHLLPFLVMAADYSENACIITMLKKFPDFSDSLVYLSSFFTSLKWSLLAVQTFVIGVGLWVFIFYRMTRGKVIST